MTAASVLATPSLEKAFLQKIASPAAKVASERMYDEFQIAASLAPKRTLEDLATGYGAELTEEQTGHLRVADLLLGRLDELDRTRRSLLLALTHDPFDPKWRAMNCAKAAQDLRRVADALERAAG